MATQIIIGVVGRAADCPLALAADSRMS